MKKKICVLCAAVLTALAGVASVLAAPAAASDDAPDETAERLRLPVVMYHHISEKEKLWGKYVVSVDEFERDLQYLQSAGYESVSVKNLLDWAEGNFTMPEKPCIITFDDGYETTGEYAAPLLEKYGFTGVVAVIGSVARQYSETPDHDLRYSHLNWETVAELSHGDTMEVQCHTWDMHRLSPRRGCNKKQGEGTDAYFAAIEEDTAAFRADCETYGVSAVPAVAYPFGAYCRETVETYAALGFRVGFTCTEKVNSLAGRAGELMELGRYNRPHGVSSERFFAKWTEN